MIVVRTKRSTRRQLYAFFWPWLNCVLFTFGGIVSFSLLIELCLWYI